MRRSKTRCCQVRTPLNRIEVAWKDPILHPILEICGTNHGTQHVGAIDVTWRNLLSVDAVGICRATSVHFCRNSSTSGSGLPPTISTE